MLALKIEKSSEKGYTKSLDINGDKVTLTVVKL